jgi:hypothetical protein
MPSRRVTVDCPDCDLEAEYDGLGPARERVERHREATGHDPVWDVGRLAAGVERSGDRATVCGREGGEGCGGALTPFSRPED